MRTVARGECSTSRPRLTCTPAPLAHADETSWREQAQRVCLWGAVTAQLTLFLILDHRDKPAAQKLLGESFPGVLVSDR